VQFIGNQVLEEVDDPPPNAKLYFKDLPDNWAGAYSLRNGIQNYLLLLYDRPVDSLKAKKAEDLSDARIEKINKKAGQADIYIFQYYPDENVLKSINNL